MMDFKMADTPMTDDSILTPPSTADSQEPTSPVSRTSCHIFGCTPLCSPDNLCCPLKCTPTCPHSTSVFKKPSIITPQNYQPASRDSNRLKRPYVADPDSITSRYGRHSALPTLTEPLPSDMAPVSRSVSVPLMDLTPSQTNTSIATHHILDSDYRPSTSDTHTTCTPSPTTHNNPNNPYGSHGHSRSHNLSRLFYSLGSAANTSTSTTGIKRRRLTSAFGGTEKVYLNGPVYELQKASQDCWRAIKGIDMELEDLELRYTRLKEAEEAGHRVDEWEFGKIEDDFRRLTEEKRELEEEYRGLLSQYEAEKEKLNREFSFREKVKKGARNVWKVLGGKSRKEKN